ncbi:hypothetical protein [Stutzerimonas nitrititolerans]|uniref:hypothetical protein n=1 Tax=Stutzerimonas nitrititolerans TaxID=2482751 RepID=UPI0028AA23B2|nr:hypothetical protein [Stutzerimonas nitrititolerans]
MKVKALARLSGAVGDREKNEEFSVNAEQGKSLIARKLVVEVPAEAKAETRAKAEAKG